MLSHQSRITLRELDGFGDGIKQVTTLTQKKHTINVGSNKQKAKETVLIGTRRKRERENTFITKSLKFELKFKSKSLKVKNSATE